MSNPHDPDSSRERQVPQELTINTGVVGQFTPLARILAGMTTDKVLTLFVAGAFGWLLYSTIQQSSGDKLQTARMYEDSRERDRRHCDDREDKIARDRDMETEKMRLWYSAQSEMARKFENDQREKDRAVIAELTRVISKKFAPQEDDCPPTSP